MMNLSVNAQDEAENQTDPVLSFCKSEWCRGKPLKEVTRAAEEDCSICLLEFDSKRVVRLGNCNHFFCQECFDDWKSRFVLCFILNYLNAFYFCTN